MNNKAIWSPKPHAPQHQACCKIPYGDYEISIAMDDSCGRLDTMRRSDIRIFNIYSHTDVTDQFWNKETCGNVVYATADSLKYIFSQIDIFGTRD